MVINTGLNVRTNFTLPENFIRPLRQATSEGKVSMKTIDSCVADVLRVSSLWDCLTILIREMLND